ncbi:MAG: FlgD immunoglobulin-like domain containing protein [Candidatus Latescibacterota bacterium]
MVERSDSRPQTFALQQNYPNPFNSGTVIRFALRAREEVELAVFNLAGQQVATLVEGVRGAGAYTINWDGLDDRGQALASGLYLYRLRAGGGGEQVETRKLVLVR